MSRTHSTHRSTLAPIALATLAGTLAATLGACRDAATAPAAAPPPAAPRAEANALTPQAATTAVTLQVRTATMDPADGIPGTTVSFKGSNGVTEAVADNSALDTDPREGFFRVWMPWAAAYTATIVTFPAHYAVLPTTKTVGGFVSPTAAPLGTLFIRRLPVADAHLYLNGKLTPGQTIKVTGPNAFAKSYTDGSASDGWFGGFYPNDGYINFELPAPGMYTVCATTTPIPNWAAACRTMMVPSYDAIAATDLFYAPQLTPR